MGFVIFLVCLLFFADRPPKPPSPNAFALIDKPGMFKSSIIDLFKNRDMQVLMICFGFIQGTFNTLGTIVGEATAKYDYTNDNASLFGALFIVGGIIGSACFGIYVETTKKYKVAVSLICIGSFISTVGCYFVLPMKTVAGFSALCFFQGFCMVSIMAVSFDYGVELTFPIGESFSTGVLLSSG